MSTQTQQFISQHPVHSFCLLVPVSHLVQFNDLNQIIYVESSLNILWPLCKFVTFCLIASKTEDTVDGQNVDANAGACSGKKYDCVICNQSTPSRSGQYVGLVVFLQSTSGSFFRYF